MKKNVSIKEFNKRFPDDDACLEHLFRQEFPHPKCQHCGKVGEYYKATGRACYTCSCGKSHIYPKAGTIFEKSSTSLYNWFYAIFLMSSSRNGVACREIQRATQVTLKTAWRMQKQIRFMMQELPQFMEGDVEADETYVGGRRSGKRGRGAEGKVVVFGTLERGKKRVQTAIVPNTSAKTLLPHFKDHTAKSIRLITDEMKAYKRIAKVLDIPHESVNHSAKEYVRDDIHTNTLENFWGQLKRSLDGTYHVVSPKYLGLYVSEFQFRYNHRFSLVPMFELLLDRVALAPAKVARQIGAYQWTV